jgi:hypothetical protein
LSWAPSISALGDGRIAVEWFGAIRSETVGQANEHRFTGQQVDGQTASYLLPSVKGEFGFKCRELP